MKVYVVMIPSGCDDCDSPSVIDMLVCKTEVLAKMYAERINTKHRRRGDGEAYVQSLEVVTKLTDEDLNKVLT